MKKLFLAAAVLALASFGFAQDAHLSVHDFSVTFTGGVSAFQGCKGCHVPHGGAIAGDTTQPQRNTVWGTGSTGAGDYTTGTNKLWDKLMSTNAYTTYSSDNVALGSPLGAPGSSTDPAWHSYLCFSCHDGTVAGLNIPSGTVATDNFLMSGGNGDTDLTNDHPVDIAWPTDTINYELPANVTGALTTFNKQAMPLYGGTGAGANKIECATCHNPHYQAGVLSTAFRGNFLRVGLGITANVSDNTSLCRTCHLSKR